MSVYVSTEVWRNSQASGITLLVLVSLADQANDEGECWPKIESIAKRCRISRATVFRHLDKLRELGELTWETRSDRGQSNVYTIMLAPRLTLTPPPSQPETPPVSLLRPQEPSLETSLETDTSAPSFDDFWRVYPRHIGRAAAERKWKSATRLVAASVIVAGAERYAAHVAASGTALEFVAHPTTWLNQGRWDDELPEASQGQAGGSWW